MNEPISQETSAGAGGLLETGTGIAVDTQQDSTNTTSTMNPSSSTDSNSDQQQDSPTTPSYSDLLAQIAEQNKQLAAMTEMLNKQFRLTNQAPTQELSAGELYVTNPNSLTSRILAQHGIKKENT